MLRSLAAKEFTDNALDAADAASRPGEVAISVDHDGNLIVEDVGIGIANATPEKLAGIFCVARAMISSKLLRRPTRGCVGNGLRVCLGWLTATRGRLIVETGRIRVELVPEIDGQSRIGKVETIEPIAGLRLTAVAGDERFRKEDLGWAEDAIELAKQSSAPAFIGRPSPHWMDLDHFRVLLRSAVGNISVRQFLAQFDGCTGSKAQTKIAAPFLRRAAADLTSDEAAVLLTLAQRETKPPKPKALHPLGRNTVVATGYAIAEGTFLTGLHTPHAAIPFFVECWADAPHPEDQPASAITTLYMNRTVALVRCSCRAWHRFLDISIGGTEVRVSVPAGPHYEITIAVTACMFPMTSDGKAPDCRVFRSAMIEAVGKAAKQAGNELAAQMSAAQKWLDRQRNREEREEAQALRIADREARQQRQAAITMWKAEQKKLPTIKDVVLELLPGAIELEARSGHLFNTRRLLYRIRDEVLRRTGKELIQNTFDRLVTEIEAETGDLHPLLIREARGNFRIPHHLGGTTLPLGTLTVRQFHRPAWTFNKIVTIEKEDLRLMLEQARWDQRHDTLLMSSKGFNSRAARDLIDKIAGTSEPVLVFSVHDADAAGTLIQHTLQHATLARGARKIEVIDLGLQPWEGIDLGLSIEKVLPTHNKNGTEKRRPVGEYVKARTDPAPKGETWEEWLQHSRLELNAFTSAELIAWLDQKMAQHDAGKLIPPDDILQDQFSERARPRADDSLQLAIITHLDRVVATMKAEEVEAKKPLLAEIDRISAPLLAELSRVRAPLLEQVRQVSEPFRRRIADAHAEADAIDRETLLHQVIERMLPDVNKLRQAITNVFTKEPTRHWEPVLHEIADRTDIGEIDLPDGNNPNRSRDDEGDVS
jgi:DNA topoisomerase VI subunit B